MVVVADRVVAAAVVVAAVVVEGGSHEFHKKDPIPDAYHAVNWL